MQKSSDQTLVLVLWDRDSLCSQGIEQLKKEEKRWAKKSKWMNMKVVFGHPFSLAWMSPFAPPDHGKANLYQYVVWDGRPDTSPALSLHKHLSLLLTLSALKDLTTLL